MANPSLALRLEQLDSYIDEFLTMHTDIKLQEQTSTAAQKTFKFIKTGQDLATVIIYVKKGGLITITYKTGKNHPLGKIFHDFLESKCEAADANKANVVLKGISEEDITFIIDLMADEYIGENKAFLIASASPTAICNTHVISCEAFKDSITLSYHTTTHRLQIQGRALFCYRTLSYHLSTILNQESLLSVVEKNSSEDRVILHEEVASQYVKKALPVAYDRLDDTYRNLLTSSYCVKIASPILSEYSMLLYPDLRVLEGVIKEVMAKNNLFTSSEGKDIGLYFNGGGKTELKSEFNSNFNTPAEILSLEECYAYFKKHRHSLFHMDENGFESRTTDTIGEVMQMSENIAKLIDAMYANCKKL